MIFNSTSIVFQDDWKRQSHYNIFNGDAECLPKDITKLDLSLGYNTSAKILREIIPVVSHMTSVRDIDFSKHEGGFSKIFNLAEPVLAEFLYITTLDLFGNGLTEVPDFFKRFKNLEILNLGRNLLTHIPDWIGELVHLKELRVFENSLSGIVTCEIGKLVNLEILDLSQPDANGITELPEEITNCTKLRSLELTGNKLKKLPDAIGDMSSLTNLYLSGTKLTKLPDSFVNLKNLLRLDVSHNKIIKIPYQIAHLPSLQMVALQGNKFKLTGSLKRYHKYMNTIFLDVIRTDDYKYFHGEGVSIIEHCCFVDNYLCRKRKKI
jgi:Leucine-rich repeat (LRR) protein